MMNIHRSLPRISAKQKAFGAVVLAAIAASVVPNAFALPECLANPIAGATCKLPAGLIINTGVPILVSASGFHLNCEAGAALTTSSARDLLSVEADNVTISGCHFRADPGGASDALVTVTKSHNFTFTSNFLDSGPKFGLKLADVSHAFIRQNTSQNLQSDSIFVTGSSDHVTIADNTLDSSTSVTTWHHVIGAHSSTPGKAITNLVIARNHITNGRSFCVEVGTFGGGIPTMVNVANNECIQTIVPDLGFGGYSFDTVDQLTVSSNIYTNRTSGTPRLPGIELVSGTSALATNNQILGAGISINKQSTTTVSDNYVGIRNVGKPGASGIYVGSSVARKSISNDKILHNQIKILDAIPPGTRVYGIRVQCNANIDCSNLSILNNSFIGAGSGDSVAIGLERAASGGVMQGLVVQNNQISSFASCYSVSPTGIQGTVAKNSEGCGKAQLPQALRPTASPR